MPSPSPSHLDRVFFDAGPTAVGKSDVAATLAALCGGEIIGADAFQIYEGMPILTAKPSATALGLAPHHLIGVVPIEQSLDLARYAEMACECIAGVISRGKIPIVVGGAGLYMRALTHGLSDLPKADPALRAELVGMPLPELQEKLRALDPGGAASIDLQNPRRVIRAIEVCLLSGKPFSAQRDRSEPLVTGTRGVVLTRDREELYARIDQRVEQMFSEGVLEEAARAAVAGPTASQVIGLRQIRDHLAGKLGLAACIAEIQQATRRYAKRQLTWLRREVMFDQVNLTNHRDPELLFHELLRRVEWLVASQPSPFSAGSNTSPPAPRFSPSP